LASIFDLTVDVYLSPRQPLPVIAVSWTTSKLYFARMAAMSCREATVKRFYTLQVHNPSLLPSYIAKSVIDLETYCDYPFEMNMSAPCGLFAAS